jgi:hypothetical protein
VNRPLAAPLIRSVRTSLGAVSHEFGRDSHEERIVRTSVMSAGRSEKESSMFKLPAYDPTAIAMLGFGILVVFSLPFIF